MLKPPKDDAHYSWTYHVAEKMRHYGISEGRVKRIIRFPKRTEEGIVEDTIAVMQPAGTKRYQEMWVMYRPMGKKLRVITAWRYPGKSPARNPVPAEIIEEVRKLL